MKKSTVVILIQLNIKNNKIDEDNFEKNHNKKNHVGNTVAIHNILKKKLRSKILNQLNMKKIKSTKTILKKKKS